MQTTVSMAPDSVSAVQAAKLKARKGHQDWLVWRTHQGHWAYARATAEAIKAAMLATGTARRFWLYAANSGVGHTLSWRLALTVRRNMIGGAA